MKGQELIPPEIPDGETNSLLNILEKRAGDEPDRIAFSFHHQPPCSFGDLWVRIQNTAEALMGLLNSNEASKGKAGSKEFQSKENLLIAIPNSPEFFYAFYGVQLAGRVAVPVFPGSGAERFIKLAKLCDADLIVVSKENSSLDFEELRSEAKGNGKQLVFIEDCLKEKGEVNNSKGKGNRQFPEIKAEDTAFIQFTSGSVGDPKGVILSHGNLLTNIRQMMAGMEITADDRFVSWLPVYHDMGLILMTMVPFYLAIPLTLLPTGLNHLKSWLEAISRSNATFTAAPDFAYRLCLLYIREPEKYALASLRVALNAAEPVRLKTIRDFEKHFKLKNVMLPAYGLAEATVGVCSAKPGKEPVTDSRGNVSVGFPFPDVEMKILSGTSLKNENGELETENTAELSEGNSKDNIVSGGPAGEIGVKSKANCLGYLGKQGTKDDPFDGKGFIKTGDIGYVDEKGNWFIIGRKKNIIIQGGLNIAAREVEELTDEFSFIRRSAALGIALETYQGEQVFIFAEVNPARSELQKENILEDLSGQIVRRFLDNFGFRPGRVFLLKSGSIPMTYNGKIKYFQLKTDYSEGVLKAKGRILFPDI